MTGQPIVTAVRPQASIKRRCRSSAWPRLTRWPCFVRPGSRCSGSRPAINILHREVGLQYALASRRLDADGAEILYRTSAILQSADRSGFAIASGDTVGDAFLTANELLAALNLGGPANRPM